MTDLRGWEQSAAAWIAAMGDQGDDHRRFVLDRPMLELATSRSDQLALDVGCGEGRFCRLLKQRGIETVGLDPTSALLAEAQCRDPDGEYVLGRAEMLPFETNHFGLVIAYLSLIDIADMNTAVSEMARVLSPGGRLLIANLNSAATAGQNVGWMDDQAPAGAYQVADYFTETAVWVTWRGVTVENWHRPFGAYVAALTEAGFQMRCLLEPEPYGGDPACVARYRRAPAFLIMEWEKSAVPGVN